MTTKEDVEFLRKKVRELERENEHLAMENQFLNGKIDAQVEYFMKKGEKNEQFQRTLRQINRSTSNRNE